MKTNQILLLVVLLWCSALNGLAQGSAFTYQGRLTEAGGPSTGVYDLRFAVYDAATVGVQQGSATTNANTIISNGLFTVILDFGAGVFNGANRWLEIGVRTNGGGGFNILSPRQFIASTPYALRAGVAATASSVASSNITGTLSVAQLSTNVALRTGGNNFTGNQFLTNGNLNMDGGILGKNLQNAYEYAFIPRLFGQAAVVSAGIGGFIVTDPGLNAMMIMPTNGNLGLGIDPGANRLQIDSTFHPANGYGLQVNKSDYGANIQINRPAAAGGLGLVVDNSSAGDGSTHVLLVRNDALNNPKTLLTVRADGNVGIGTNTPLAKLDVVGAGRSALVRPPSPGQSSYLEFNNSNGSLRGIIGADGNGFSGGSNQFSIAAWTSHPIKFFTAATERMTVAANGNVGIGTATPATRLEVAGEITTTALNITSDRNAKEGFNAVNARAVLDKVARLPITEWQYKTQTDARHIGPMAQDFHQAFGFGRDDKHITSIDADGVALAAIQGLNEKLDEQVRDKDARIQQLEKTVAELKALVGRLAGGASPAR